MKEWTLNVFKGFKKPLVAIDENITDTEFKAVSLDDLKHKHNKPLIEFNKKEGTFTMEGVTIHDSSVFNLINEDEKKMSWKID